jgi:hypothetical protein
LATDPGHARNNSITGLFSGYCTVTLTDQGESAGRTSNQASRTGHYVDRLGKKECTSAPNTREKQFLVAGVFLAIQPAPLSVYDHYARHNGERKTIEVWKFNQQVQMVEAGTSLRIQANSPFLLHWTKDDWWRATDTPSRTTAMGIDYADIAVPNGAVSLQFTFLWVDEDRWEGKEYNVQASAPGAEFRCE